MIISHKYKFIFIKTKKTAGTSIEIALSKYLDKGDIITKINEEDMREGLGYPGPQNYRVPYWKYTFEDLKRLLFQRQLCVFYNHAPATYIRKYIGEKVWNSYYKFCFERNPWDKTVSSYFF